MNLIHFLEQTDAMAVQYPAEQLRTFIHEIGRVLPESEREDFLKRLKAAGEKPEKESEKKSKKEPEKEPAGDTEGERAFQEQYQRIRNNLKIIDSQEIALEAVWNEEYDDWYGGGEEWTYRDNCGISDMLAEACAFVHTCLDRERYREGYQIGKQLFSMEILYTSEDYDEGEISLEDMVQHELLYCDLGQMCLDTAYCAYHAMPSGKQPEAVYEILVNREKDEAALEALMQHRDEELPDFQEFLLHWITFLGTKAERDAGRFLLEAAGLLNDASAAAAFAKKYAAVHPGLYLSLLENRNGADISDMVSLGRGWRLS